MWSATQALTERLVETVRELNVPSPQSKTQPNESFAPGSVNVAVATAAAESGIVGERKASDTVGATFVTARCSVADTGGLTPSSTVIVRPKMPLSVHVTVVAALCGSVNVQRPGVSVDQEIVPSDTDAPTPNGEPSGTVPAKPVFGSS